MKRAHNFVDKSGTRKGRLAILRVDPERTTKKSVYYVCECDCGTVKSIHSSNLRPKGKSVSCGCYRLERVRQDREPQYERRLTAEERGKHLVRENYIKRARNAEMEFSLNDDQFYALIAANCEYCNDGPSNFFHLTKKKRSHEYVFSLRYNGIDRQDNAAGYTPENCVSCCMVCNYMKHTMSAGEFKARTLRIVAHWASKEKIK